MAGSAVNLTGMLSQMNENLGRMGNTIGEGMFNPLLDVQRERAEERKAEKLKAAEVAKQKGLVADMQAAQNAAQEASLDPAANGDKIAAARKALQQKALENPKYADRYLEQDKQLAAQEVALRTQSNVKGVIEIDKQLRDPNLDPEKREALMARRSELSEMPGVKSAIAGLQKKAREAELHKLELEGAQHQRQIRRDSETVASISQAVLAGAPLDELRKRGTGIPDRIWNQAEKELGPLLKARREREQWELDKKDNSALLKDTEFGETYDLYAKFRGNEDANKWAGRAIEEKAKKESAERMATQQEIIKLDAKGKIHALLNQPSKSNWLPGWYMDDDLQEAYQDLDDDMREEAEDYAAAVYATQVKTGADEEVALEQASKAISEYLGIKVPEKVDSPNTNQAADIQATINNAMAEIEKINAEMAELNGQR